MIAHRERHVAAIDVGHQRADRLLHFRSLEALEPLGILLGEHEAILLDAIDAAGLDLDLLLAGAEQFERG